MTARQKNIPALRFPEFKNGWKSIKLKNLSTFFSGYAFKSELFNEAATNKLVIPKNFTKNGYANFTTENTKFTVEKVDDKYLCKSGDLLVLLTDLTPSCELLGKPLFIKDEDGTLWLNQRIVRVQTDNTLLPKYLLYFLLTEKYHKRIKETATGTTVRHSSNKILGDTIVPIPSLPEQQKIADFLTAVDDRLQQLIKKKNLLEQYKKGMMQKLFSRELRFKDNKGKDFPEWEEKKLGEVFSASKGNGLSKSAVVEDGNNECILYGELYTTYNEVIEKVISRTNETEGVKSKVGDILIPCSTTTTGIDLANVTELKKADVLLGGDITILRSKKTICSTFYAYYLTHFKKYEIAKFAQGSTIVHLSYSHFKMIDIAIPSLSEQQKIADFLISIDDKINEVQTQIQQTQQYKKGLLQQMFPA